MMPSGTATSAASVKPPSTRQIVMPMSRRKPCLVEEVVALLDHGEGIGEEGLGDVAAQGGEAPGRHEQHEEQDAEATRAVFEIGASGFMPRP